MEKEIITLQKSYRPGAVVKLDTPDGVRYVKVAKELDRRAHLVTPATERQYKTRIGTIKLNDWRADEEIGNVVEINGEFLHIEKIERTGWGTNEAHGPSGTHVVGFGHYVDAKKAAALKAEYDAKMAPVLAERASRPRLLPLA